MFIFTSRNIYTRTIAQVEHLLLHNILVQRTSDTKQKILFQYTILRLRRRNR